MPTKTPYAGTETSPTASSREAAVPRRVQAIPQSNKVNSTKAVTNRNVCSCLFESSFYILEMVNSGEMGNNFKVTIVPIHGKWRQKMGKTYGYVRVSTQEQNEDRQVLALHEAGIAGKYNLAETIDYIIDDNVRNQGNIDFQGRNIPVRGSAEIKSLDYNNFVIIITSDYYWEAYEKLCSIEEVTENFELIYYFENQETAYEMEYRRQYQEAALENIIVFRSGPHASSYIEGTDFYDNARALFEYMLRNGYNRKYELVWLVKYPEQFQKHGEAENVSFLSFDWSVSRNEKERGQYYRALCLAKYIFFTDAYGFARNCRRDQVRVQLWHGCGFKTRVNFVRCEKRYEYTTVISGVYSKIHQEIYGLREDQVLVTGYAKQDWLFDGLEEQKWEWLQIPEDAKCIFWLPTFRTATEALKTLSERQTDVETGLPIVDSVEKLARLNELLKKRKLMLLIKLHPFQDRSAIACENMSNIILLDNHELFTRDIQINQLLNRADALISDYSSAAVDFMLMDKPIAFTLDDVEEYASSRGFVFDPMKDWLPGKLIYTFEQFCNFLKEIAAGEDTTRDKRRVLTDKLHKYHDGNNCKRILEALGI